MYGFVLIGGLVDGVGLAGSNCEDIHPFWWIWGVSVSLLVWFCFVVWLLRFVCRTCGIEWEVSPVPSTRAGLGGGGSSRAPHSAALALPQTRRALWPGMALRPPGEAGPQDRMCFPPERLQSSPQHLTPYYTPFPSYGPYGSNLMAAEEDFQSFLQLEASVPASPAMPPFAFGTAPPFLSPGLALQREPLYDLPWHGKLPPWYPFPYFPKELQPFPNGGREDSREDPGATGKDLAYAGSRSDSGHYYEPEIFNPPPPVDTSLLPEGPKTSQLLPCLPSQQSEDGPKLPNEERTSHRYHFTQEDLHLVLYGVLPSQERSTSLHHAASGLLVPTDHSGKGALLGASESGGGGYGVWTSIPDGACGGQAHVGGPTCLSARLLRWVLVRSVGEARNGSCSGLVS